MHLGQRGHATIEMLFLIPLILIIMSLIWISGEFLYIKHRTILASKCLALDELNYYYGQLAEKKSIRSSPYENGALLHNIFFKGQMAQYDVFDGKNAKMPERAPADGTAPEFGGWNKLTTIVTKARGTTSAVVNTSYKPLIFWPEGAVNISDTTYTSASDWRYDEFPDGYLGMMKDIFSEIGSKILGFI